jgi:hypothetical protein
MEARLWSIAASCLYAAILYLWQGITGDRSIDGAIGIVIGLYTCSHPASYFLSLLFFERGAGTASPDVPSGWAWAGFNVLVMIVGWLAVILGTTQMAGAS